MLRCVRKTWITPSMAKLKLSMMDGRTLMREPVLGLPSPPRGRSRRGATRRAPEGRAMRLRQPEGKARRRRADEELFAAADHDRRSGTQAHLFPRRSRDARA